MAKQKLRYGYKYITCPMCKSKTFDYVSYSEFGWGTVEQHGFCHRCGFVVEQAYSPCLLVPQRINVLFVNRPNLRGLPNGVYKVSKGYFAKYNNNDLGTYETIDMAFAEYAKEKKKEIVRMAIEYKSVLPKRTYDCIVNYEVKIENDKNYAA